MHKSKQGVLLLALGLLHFLVVEAQEAKVASVEKVPAKIYDALTDRASDVEKKLERSTSKYLASLSRMERKLKAKLAKKDSLLALQLFSGIEEKYAVLQKVQENFNKYSQVYSGHLDSLQTALHFLQTGNIAGVELQRALASYSALQGRLQQANGIRSFLAERKRLLTEQFQRFGMLKQVKGFQKKAHYYSRQVQELKEWFEGSNKWETKLLELMAGVPAFRNFFAKHSQLGSLFALPGAGDSGNGALVQGLQTREILAQQVASRFGSGINLSQQLQQNVQSVQGQLNALTNLANGSLGNSSAIDIPDFKPNSQATKSFGQRLEYGFNVQSQKASSFFPVTSDFGLSLGYKLNDRSVVGMGASYKLGWGRNWNHIRVTHQGVGLRTYLDWQLKGQLYISGGYEQNYKTEIHSIDQLKDHSAWQSSGLVGLSKRYQISKKIKGDMKILWDFLSYQQVPRAQPLVFRIGYRLK